MSELKPLQQIIGHEDFVTKPGVAFFYNGRTYDLRKVDRHTAEALANDPRVSFIQWADEAKRPQGQKSPLSGKPAKAPSGK
jgi:hypothetical protein